MKAAGYLGKVRSWRAGLRDRGAYRILVRNLLRNATVGTVTIDGESLDPSLFWAACARENVPRTRYLELVIRLRDSGFADIAAELLADLSRTEPNNVDIWVERLVIPLFVKFDIAAAAQIAQEIPFAARSENRIRLLSARLACGQGRLADSVRLLLELGGEDFAAIPFFFDQRKRVLVETASGLAQAEGLAAGLNESNWVLNLCVAFVAEAVFSSDHDRSLLEWARLCYLDDSVAYKHLIVDLICLRQVYSDDPVRVGLAFIHAVTTKWNELIDTLMQRISREPALLNNLYLTKYVLLAHWAPGYPELYRTIALQWRRWCEEGLPLDQLGEAPMSAVVTSLEVASRLAALNAVSIPDTAFAKCLPLTKVAPRGPRGRRVFVGLFGQMRFFERCLPRLNRYIAALGHGSDLRLTVGASTWDRTGQQTVVETTPVGHLYQRLPTALVSVLQSRFPVTVADVRKDFPAICERALEEAESETVSPEAIAHHFDVPVHIDISSDDVFMEQTGRTFLDRTRLSEPYLNQARMFHRIAGLGRLAKQAAIAEGESFDCYVIMRCDMNFSQDGSLRPFVDRILETTETNLGFCDHDSHACLINGIGDRYFVLDPAAAERLFDVERVLTELLARDASLHAPYLNRMAAHQFLSSLFFEHGTKLEWIGGDAVNWAIERGALSMDDLRDCIARDAQRASGSLKIQLESLLQQEG